jgi:imidazole glycerol-phosphate synthase subunit HisF
MYNRRVIPVLLLSNYGFYKTKKFNSKTYVGDPINIIKIFNQKEVDELIILDITNNEKIDFDFLKDIASESFAPMTYGGGIKTVKDAGRILELGFEKISVQKSAFNDIGFLNKLSSNFGSSSVIFSIDFYKNFWGKTKIRNNKSNFSLIELIELGVKNGAGEIILNDVNRDGMKSGLNQNIAKEISQQIDVPLTLVGGANSFNDIINGFKNGLSGVGVGKMFGFHGELDGVLISYLDEKQLNKIKYEEI